ncbi:hypothetical protein K435DRAFT_863061 [Dendrothele bispora CBS 962.96]|uniref:Mid2 domain-containing protein n=1 Tax=Dendrothele bispora (strain CBS 962.96) TaxID=1314807 RepID=A0A4S8LRI8_DENBC|nr:hypothetical protein K435DRAFT_863061 [Dendrothele bispora CBS 962.96]
MSVTDSILFTIRYLTSLLLLSSANGVVTAYDLELNVTSVPRNKDFELVWSRIPANGDPLPFQLVLVMDAPSRTSFSVLTTETQGSTATRTLPAPTDLGIYRIVGVRGTDTVFVLSSLPDILTPDAVHLYNDRTAFPGIDDGSSTSLWVFSSEDTNDTSPSISSSALSTTSQDVSSPSMATSSMNPSTPTVPDPTSSTTATSRLNNSTAIILASTLGTASLLLMLLILFIVLRRGRVMRILKKPDSGAPAIQAHGITAPNRHPETNERRVPTNNIPVASQSNIEPFLLAQPLTSTSSQGTSYNKSGRRQQQDREPPPSYSN